MYKNLFRFILLTVLLTFLIPFTLFAQTSRSDIRRVRTFDVQQYTIRTSFDRSKKIVFGDTTVQFTPLNDNFNEIALDAARMDFKSVTIEPQNVELNYKLKDDKIYIDLKKKYNAGELISIRFKYSTKPLKGIYFVDDYLRKGEVIRDGQIWTQGEAEEAHHWFPSYDFPDDKALTEQFITVDKSETAIANGELLETLENSDGTKTFHFKMNQPHSTYLTSFVVGKYKKIEEKYEDIPLGYYIYPNQTDVFPLAYGKTKQMFKVFEELTQIKYPFNKYDQIMVADFNFGGMENITATTMADTEILLAKFDFARENVMDLVSHELAHSWFGNLVTCKNWSELWLNEGFATFMEAAFREKLKGHADYITKIKSDADQFMIEDAYNRKKHGLYNLIADPNRDDTMFDTTTYQKGGAVIHTLRKTVGDEAFWKGVNIYLSRHKFENVETSDLKNAMEEASNMKLDWFFKQWVYGGGFPKLLVNQFYDTKTKKLHLSIIQTQKSDNLIPEVFILPMDVHIKTANGEIVEQIDITKREQDFSFDVKSKPISVILDKGESIPLKDVKYRESKIRPKK